MAQIFENAMRTLSQYECKKTRALIKNEMIADYMPTILKYEVANEDKFKLLYHGIRSVVTNLTVFSELIMNINNESHSKYKYYYKGEYNQNNKIPKNEICCVPSLFTNIQHPGENVFDFMNNKQVHGRHNCNSASFDIDYVLKDLTYGKIIDETKVDKLKTLFESFDKANWDSCMLIVYGILMRKPDLSFNKKFIDLNMYDPNGKFEACITQESVLPQPNNFHIKLIDFNPNDNDVIVKQYHNIKNFNTWKVKIGEILECDTDYDSDR